MTNFGLPEAVERLKNTLQKIGVDKMLKRWGVEEDETVRICGREFEWSPSQPRERFRKRFVRLRK
ncbi:MAG: Obg family GTPase CgtA [Elusimicrobia bacterium]|nr:Obg family GTPase CgtA [Elusimicrobiota bacterium]